MVGDGHGADITCGQCRLTGIGQGVGNEKKVVRECIMRNVNVEKREDEGESCGGPKGDKNKTF